MTEEMKTADITSSSSAAGEATAASAPKPQAATTPPPDPKPQSSQTTTTPKKYSLDDARKELTLLITSSKITNQDCPAIRSILKEHVLLKEKVDKLKSLLGRSAKAQRETKVDFEASQKRLGNALREIERLSRRLETLQSRPSHLDLLMDFETNFDKALLSVGQQQQQTGGQETSAPAPKPTTNESQESDSALDSMLLNELGEAKSRIEKLEGLNAAVVTRSSQLESVSRKYQQELDILKEKNARLELESKMAKLEAEHATRAMQDKAASLDEMQIEIDLVLKANTKANLKAAAGEEAIHSVQSDKERVAHLQSQVTALQEWALASTESKRLVQERCQFLETKLSQLQKSKSPIDEKRTQNEKKLFDKQGSMVIGAGDFAFCNIELGEHVMTHDTRFVVLNWKFDFSPTDHTISFNICKGKLTSKSEFKKASYLIQDRIVYGGAGGESQLAFTTDDHTCTLMWSNEKSWIRPRTVKYQVEVVALK